MGTVEFGPANCLGCALYAALNPALFTALVACFGLFKGPFRRGLFYVLFMNLSAKIDLENCIFARASRLSAPVDGVCGGLASPEGDICLQKLISVYNRFFAAENGADLPDENSFLTWQEFVKERHFLPFLCPKGVPFYACDFKANLFCWENKFDK